jgi:hypothetical protein
MFYVNLASLEEGDIVSVAGALECMVIDYTNLLGRAAKYEEDIQTYESQMQEMKAERTKCQDDLCSLSKTNRRLVNIGAVNKIVRRALEPNDEISSVVLSVLQDKHFNVTLTKLTELVKAQRVEKTESLKLDSDHLGNITDEMLNVVQRKGDVHVQDNSPTSKAVGGVLLFYPFDAGDTNPVQEELDKIKVGTGSTFSAPSSPEEWSRVFRGLRLKKELRDFQESHAKLISGCSKFRVYAGGGESIREDFVDMLKALKDDLDAISSDDDRNTLKQFLADISMSRETQARVKQLSTDIKTLDSKLLFAKVARTQSKRVMETGLGKLRRLAQLAEKMKSSDAQSTKKLSGKAVMRNRNFVKAFQDALCIMPLMVMTPEQVSRFVPIGHRFGLCIVDEASQADCSALILMPRANQMVVIGDHKQVCPDEHTWSDEAVKALDANLPDITSADNLKPRHSFFDLCQVAFTLSAAFLQDHFRCPPDGIAWSSENLYHSRINTYRPSGNEPTLLHFLVKGEMDTKTKKNQVEAEKIVRFVKDHIEKAAADDGCPVLTFGIISMAGANQCKLIEELLEEALYDLNVNYGSKAVDRHRIKCGVPSQFQGSERDVILISCVYDAKSVKSEIDQESQKIWNVATTRHKCQSVLFHSYDPMDKKKVKIPVKDHKREIFAQYQRAEYASKNPWEKESHDVRGIAERKLREDLLRRGFQVRRNEGNVWSHALSVGVKGGVISKSCVLLNLENYGESDDDWKKMVDQQWDLEQAGTACLRVDTLALSLRFELALDDIVKFLKEAGLAPTPVVGPSDASPAENGFIKVSESSSDAESTLTSSQSTSGTQLNKRRGSQKKKTETKRARKKK